MSDNHETTPFSSVSKAEWLSEIQAELKDIDIKTLDWRIDEDWSLSPFAHADDIEQTTLLAGASKGRKWQVLEAFNLEDANCHDQILQALTGGCEALSFSLPNGSIDNLESLLIDVYLNMIQVHFESADSEQLKKITDALGSIIHDRDHSGDEMSGSIQLTGENQFDAQTFLHHHDHVKQTFPRMGTIGWRFTFVENGISDQITQTFSNLLSACEQVDDRTKDLLRGSELIVEIGSNYFLEVIQVRAIHLIWQNILAAHDVSFRPNIEVRFASPAYSESFETNMIRSSSMALAAVLGGADRLMITPSDNDPLSQDQMKRRIARNIHHLLRYESQLEKQGDAIRGSYFFEGAVQGLVEKVWAGLV